MAGDLQCVLFDIIISILKCFNGQSETTKTGTTHPLH